MNAIQHFAGFIDQEVELRRHQGQPQAIDIRLQPHQGMRGKCSHCLQPAPGYDRLEERSWLHLPLWGIPTYFFYAPRRVECREHGIGVEEIPWSEGKRPVTQTMMGFLARWTRRLSWKETAQVFQTSWENVYRSVEWFVQWGLGHRKLEGVRSLGMDEIHWGRGQRADNFLTVFYQIDSGCRRLLWVGPRRTQATLKKGLAALGPEVVKGLHFVCSDMWKPYLGVIAEQASPALHLLDRFHITVHVNQAVDQLRRGESTRLRAAGKKRTAQAHALDVVAPWQPSQRSSPTKAAGIVIQQAGHGTVEHVNSNGDLRIRMDSGQEVRFNVREHPHLDYGYAVTSHSSQGQTADRVLINVDTEESERLVNNRFAYVSVSRAQHDAHIYTNDGNKLSRSLSRESSQRTGN